MGGGGGLALGAALDPPMYAITRGIQAVEYQLEWEKPNWFIRGTDLLIYIS